ncbi:MAG TPA: 1-phosphofructokinase family hexose kinase [Thermoanaerobaculia bacterium]
MAEIVTLTLNPAIDESTSVDHVVSDRKLRCRAARFEPGGGGINVSRAIRRLGGESLAIYPAGGPAGTLLYSLLENEGIVQRPVEIEAWTRENVNVNEESTGRQFRFVFPGPALSQKDWARCRNEIESLSPPPAFLVASGSLPPGVPDDFYARLARWARRSRTRLVLDASGPALAQALEEGVFLVKPSLREFQAVTGLADAEESHLREEAGRLVAAGRCEAIVLSLGGAGILLVTARDAERIVPPAVPAQSTVGAGDTLLAGIVLRLWMGQPLAEAARFGVAAAAASVMRPGTELCRREDAERLYGRMLPIAV